jgi:cation diffusion facilitator family transporter
MLNWMNKFKAKMIHSNCEKCGRRVAWVGIWVNLLMVVLKLIVGVTAGSKACIADGLHSASNIITAFAIMVSQKINARKSTSQFPNGYGKVEFMAAGFITLLIIAGAVALLLVSIRHLVNQPSPPPHLAALLMALASIGVNEMMFRYMRCVATQFKSQTIMANAWANRADCFSSVAVIIGVLGARMGLHHLDPIAAIFVVVIIIRVSYKILLESINALMDGSANDIYGEEIIRIVSNVKEVHGVENLRTRHIGQRIWAEIDVLIDARANMEDAQKVARKVKDRLYANIGDLERVMVNCGCLKEEKC